MARPLSIITAIHNGLPMNRLFWKALSENTAAPFELIVIDNHSTDGSEKFFEELSRKAIPGRMVIHVRNEVNQSYPVSQKQGLRLARFEILCFLNNDIWLPRGWHEPFERELEKDQSFILSPSGMEAQPSQSASDRLKAKWKRVTAFSEVWRGIFFRSEEDRLWRSLRWMYGDLFFFRSPTPRLGPGYIDGLNGNSIIFHRVLLKKFPGIFDKRFEASDWHLYLTMAKRHEEDPAVPLPRILLDSYVHHFGRYSAKRRREAFHDTPNLTIENHWGKETVRRLWWGYRLPE